MPGFNEQPRPESGEYFPVWKAVDGQADNPVRNTGRAGRQPQGPELRTQLEGLAKAKVPAPR